MKEKIHRDCNRAIGGAGAMGAGAMVLFIAGSAWAQPACEGLWTHAVGQPGIEHATQVAVVTALAVFEHAGKGGGAGLYAGGVFTSAGGAAASNIARWDGSGWSPVGGGVNDNVIGFGVFDDGSGGGEALYVGGQFTNAGGVPVSSIAKWDGAAWSDVGGGVVGGPSPVVRALTVFDDGSGSGPALYVGGSFTNAGGVPASRIARWDGTSWSALGSGVSSTVYALTVFDDGEGPGGGGAGGRA